MPPSPECPICHKRIFLKAGSKGSEWIDCPTKVLFDVGNDLNRTRPHYSTSPPIQELNYPPFRIFLNPLGEGTTHVWLIGEYTKSILQLPKLLDLPWDNEEQVLDTLHYYLTFS